MGALARQAFAGLDDRRYRESVATPMSGQAKIATRFVFVLARDQGPLVSQSFCTWSRQH